MMEKRRRSVAVSTESPPSLAQPVALASGLTIEWVRIRNFRSLRAVTAPLGSITVLIGENNAGKTSFVDALHAAIGSGTRTLSEDDIFIGIEESAPPKDRDVTIDLLIRPAGPNGSVIDVFPDGSPWTELWGNGISQDDRGHDHVLLRAKLSWSPTKGEYVAERQFLKEWVPNIDDAQDAPTMRAALSSQQLDPLALFALDAKRDVVDDLRSRSSIWSKLISDPGLSDAVIEEIEDGLSALNETIVTQSAVLSHVETHLHTVSGILQCEEDGISITPVARHLRDLSRGMDVRFSTTGASSFPLAKQGMGTRALITMLLFRAYMTWKQKHVTDEALHPFVSLEEPEVHLHPHAQRALFQQIRKIPGQKIVSTHSPYVCSQASVTEFLHFTKLGSETRVTWCDAIDRVSGKELLTAEDLRRIDREVMNTRGDIVFCRCLVMFEGETEEQAIPAFATGYWPTHPHEFGISFVGVGGSGKYLPFLRLAKEFDIPWVIISDAESDAIKALDSALTKAGEVKSNVHPRVVLLPAGHDLESYLVTADPAYLAIIKSLIIDTRALNDKHRQALSTEWACKSKDEVIAELRSAKTQYGAHVARAFAGITDPQLRVPERIRSALDLALRIPEGSK